MFYKDLVGATIPNTVRIYSATLNNNVKLPGVEYRLFNSRPEEPYISNDHTLLTAGVTKSMIAMGGTIEPAMIWTTPDLMDFHDSPATTRYVNTQIFKGFSVDALIIDPYYKDPEELKKVFPDLQKYTKPLIADFKPETERGESSEHVHKIRMRGPDTPDWQWKKVENGVVEEYSMEYDRMLKTKAVLKFYHNGVLKYKWGGDEKNGLQEYEVNGTIEAQKILLKHLELYDE